MVSVHWILEFRAKGPQPYRLATTHIYNKIYCVLNSSTTLMYDVSYLVVPSAKSKVLYVTLASPIYVAKHKTMNWVIKLCEDISTHIKSFLTSDAYKLISGTPRSWHQKSEEKLWWCKRISKTLAINPPKLLSLNNMQTLLTKSWKETRFNMQTRSHKA